MQRMVYLETSIISYLAARPSRTIVGAAHQQLTIAWWAHRSNYDLVVSQPVHRECAAGDPDAAKRRLELLKGIPVLSVTEEMMQLAESLVIQGFVPAKAIDDALHITIATLHQVDFLLTWNCRHIANTILQERIAAYLAKRGVLLPIICTPEELLGDTEDD